MATGIVKLPGTIINHYLATLQEKIPVEGVLLFGSFAWGKPTKHSDVDLVIISPRFSRIRDRLQWLSRMRDETTYQISMDVIGYTPKEFSNIEERSAIMAKAKKDGKWLYRKG